MTSSPEHPLDGDPATEHHSLGTAHPALAGAEIEVHGLDTIPSDERVRKPRDLFWPWLGANVSPVRKKPGAASTRSTLRTFPCRL